MSRRESVLIYRLGSLGDTIIALPAFHVVREAFPQAQITLLTNLPVAAKAAPAAAVLGEGYFFDEAMAYPVGLRDPRRIWQLIRQIRQKQITTVINLAAFRSVHATWRDMAFFRLAGVRRLIGFSVKIEDQKPVTDARTGLDEWEAKRLARRVAALREVDLNDDRWWDLRITEAELSAANALLQPVRGTGPFLVVSLGTKLQANDWGLTNWQELIRRLALKLPGWGLVFVGAPEEKENSESCLRFWPGPAANLCGLCPPRVSAAVLRQARAFAGHDSGPLHLAACVGTPCVGVFSARNRPGQWFPRGRHNQIIYHRTDCAGCRLEVCLKEQKKCITSITVDEVERAVMQALNMPG